MSHKVLTAAFAACLFLLVLSAKWATFDRYGSPMPDWDQWDAEALDTFVPWFTDKNFLTHLFTPHNEHRVVLTKLQNLALVLLNGQWDSRLEAVTNAILHAALGAMFWLLGTRWLLTARSQGTGDRGQGTGVRSQESGDGNVFPEIRSSPTRYSLPATRYFSARSWIASLLFLLTFVLFALPLAWQNVLGGFHSQQYWLLGLSFAAIVALPFARSWSSRWWIGAVSAILVLGSMGSGFLAAAACLVVLGWRLFRRETSWRETSPAVLLCGVLVVVGVLTHREVTWHADMKAQSVSEFVFTIVHSLEWPWRHQHWAALLFWSPWLLLAAHLLRAPSLFPSPSRSSVAASTAPQAILALGGWVLLQQAATGYARGAGADYPASRYMDTLAFGLLANAFALAWFFTRERSPSLRDTLARTVLVLAWVLTLGLGISKFLGQVVRYELDEAKRYYGAAEGNLRRYLATSDPKHFASPDIPFPNVDGLIERLAIPTIRALLPAPIRPPLAIAPANSVSEHPAFEPNTALNADPKNPPRRGLSPRTPPLDYTTTWGSFRPAGGSSPAPATWQSAPLRSTLNGWLRFEVAGDLGPAADDLALTLRDAATGHTLATVRPGRIPGESWRSAYVRAPSEPFVIAAVDDSDPGWFAFSPPVEMGSLSFLAWQVTKHAAVIFRVTAGATLLLAVVALYLRRRDERAAAAEARPAGSTA